VLVVIDDIDRLTPLQVRLLIQLVKVNADFPNMIYLLLFQRDLVEKSLGIDGVVDGREFLDKIVQVGFNVPPVERGRMYRALFKGLEKVLAAEAVAARFDSGYWQQVFGEIQFLFGNLRDVSRYLGSLSFHVSLLSSEGSFEVNPVDLIALEALRLFEPDVYAEIQNAKDVLTATNFSSGVSPTAEAAEERTITRLLDAASPERKDAIKDLLKRLFPPAERYMGGMSYAEGFAEEWYRTARACHRDVFDRYFLLALPEGDISQAELDYFMKNAGDRDAVAAKLREHIKRGSIETLLQRLEAYKRTIKRDQILSFITAVMDVGDGLPMKASGMFSLGPEMHASRIIHWALLTIADEKERAKALRDACESTTGIYLPTQKIADQEDRSEKGRSPEAYYLSDADIAACKEVLLGRIRDAAEEDRLQRSHHLHWLLIVWMRWTDGEEVRTWVRKLIATPGGAVTYLLRLLGRSTVSDDRGNRIEYSVTLKNLELFADLETLKVHVTSLDKTKLTEEEQRAVQAFEDALQRRTEGKPDNRWGSDDDE